MYAKKERGIISGLAAGSLHEWLFILEQSNKYSRILFKLIVLKFESLELKGGGGVVQGTSKNFETRGLFRWLIFLLLLLIRRQEQIWKIEVLKILILSNVL